MKPIATPFAQRALTAAAMAALALALSACDQSKTASTPGEKLDNAIAKTDQAAQDAKAKASESAAETKADLSAAGAQVAQTAKEAGAETKEALNSAGTAVANAGTAVANAVDDAGITAAVSAGLAKDPDLSALRIDVDTKAGVVTLTGPAPNAAAKDRATTVAKGVNGVSSVVNNLEVKAM